LKRRIMVILYFVIYCSLWLFLIIVKAYSNKTKKAIDSHSEYEINFKDLKDECNNLLMRKNIPKVSIKQGSFFAFNQTENTIYLAEKEPYFLSDLFRCLHEVGHYVDFHKHRRKTYNIL